MIYTYDNFWRNEVRGGAGKIKLYAYYYQVYGDRKINMKPTFGEIDMDECRFHKFTKFGKKSKRGIHLYRYYYADTEEEATEDYNRMVKEYIEKCQRQMEEAENDLI